MLLGQDGAEGREGHPGLDGDRHVGERVIDQPVEAAGAHDHARTARDAAVVERRAAPLRIDGVTQAHLLADQVAERIDVVGSIFRQGGPAIADRSGRGGIGPGRLNGRCQGGCSDHGLGGIGIVADIFIREDAFDGLLHGPDRGDHVVVEDARPGVGEQDLRLEGQSVQGMGHAAVEQLGAAILPLELVEGVDQLRHLPVGDRHAPAQAGEERPVVSAPADVPPEDLQGRPIGHHAYRGMGRHRDRYRGRRRPGSGIGLRRPLRPLRLDGFLDHPARIPFVWWFHRGVVSIGQDEVNGDGLSRMGQGRAGARAIPADRSGRRGGSGFASDWACHSAR